MLQGISFVIPSFNEEQYIYNCLTSIIKETSKCSISSEIIVVDNCSTDKTIDIAKSLISNVYSNQYRGSPAKTRNVGALHARYDILCFIDGDCMVTENWVQRIIKTFKDESVGAYGGPALSPETGGWVEKTWAPKISDKYEVHNKMLPGSNFTIRKHIFKMLNGFNENLISAEDDDFSKRILRAGYITIWDSDHSVIHFGYPKTLSSIFKKQVWHGSTQFRAHGIWGDRVVSLTILFIVVILSLLLSIVLLKINLILICSIGVLFVPAVFVYGRSKRNKNSNFVVLLRLYIISFFFLCGRAVGLANEVIVRQILSKGQKNN